MNKYYDYMPEMLAHLFLILFAMSVPFIFYYANNDTEKRDEKGLIVTYDRVYDKEKVWVSLEEENDGFNLYRTDEYFYIQENNTGIQIRLEDIIFLAKNKQTNILTIYTTDEKREFTGCCSSYECIVKWIEKYGAKEW